MDDKPETTLHAIAKFRDAWDEAVTLPLLNGFARLCRLPQVTTRAEYEKQYLQQWDVDKMEFDYIKRAYGLDFHRGQRVEALGKPGTVTAATHHLFVKLDGAGHATPYHPTDVKPLTENQTKGEKSA